MTGAEAFFKAVDDYKRCEFSDTASAAHGMFALAYHIDTSGMGATILIQAAKSLSRFSSVEQYLRRTEAGA